MNFFSMGLPLGRWFGIRVILHWLFLLYALNEIMSAERDGILWQGVIIMVVLFGTVLLHEFGHSLACKSVGGDAPQIVLWPLGGLAFVRPPDRPLPQLWVTAAGPLVNVVLIPVFWALCHYAHFPAGESGGYLFLACRMGLYINVALLAFNLLPIYPLDGGRIFQELLWLGLGYKQSLQIAGMVGTVGGLALIALGLGVTQVTMHVPIDYSPEVGWIWYPMRYGNGVSMNTAFIGLMAVMESFAAYRRSQEISNWRKNG